MDNELYHFGVVGMKWGVRKQPSQVGRKIAKLESKRSNIQRTLNRKSAKQQKYQTKADRLYSNSSKRFSRIDWGNVGRYKAVRAAKKNGKAMRISRHIKKYNKKIARIDKRIVNLGKQYTSLLLDEKAR